MGYSWYRCVPLRRRVALHRRLPLPVRRAAWPWDVSCVLGGVRKRMGVRAGLTLDLELKNTTEVVKLLTRSCQEQTIRLHTEAVTGS